MKTVNHLGTDPIGKLVPRIAFPSMLAQFVSVLYSIVDRMYIGHIASVGDLALAGVGVCGPILTMIGAFSSLIGVGGAPLLGIRLGEKNEKEASRILANAFLMLVSLSLVLTAAALFFTRPMLMAFGASTVTYPYARAYFVIYVSGSVFALLSTGLNQFVICQGFASEGMKSVLLGAILNLLLDPVFIFVLHLGVRGAALATSLAAVINVLVILILARAQKYPYLFHFKKHFRWNKKQVKIYFVKCFPIICNEVLIGVGNMVINVVLGRQSEQAIAAIAVFRTLEGMVISFFAGFSNAASVLVGTCVGSGELDAAYERAKRLVFLCGSTILCVCLVLLGIHKPLLSAMSLSGESMEIGSHMLMIYCVAAVIRMCNWVQNDTYRAAGDAAFGTIREIAFMYAMVLPLCCYIDEPIRLILMQRHMYSGKWVRPVTPQGMEALPAFMEKHGRHKKAA